MTKEGNDEAEDGFTGNFPLTLDKTQRVTVPSNFKQVMDRKYGSTAGRVILLPGDGKVKILPIPEWERFREKLKGFSSFNKKANRVRTLIFGNMVECQLDAQNRVRLSQSLCDLAGLVKDVVVVGEGDEMQIWDAERWKSFNVETAKDLEDLMDGMDQMSLAANG